LANPAPLQYLPRFAATHPLSKPVHTAKATKE
jgi:hypothetical protein